MGGAERSARKRKQQQLANAQTARQPSGKPAGDPDRTKKIIIGVAGVLVLAGVIIGGWAWMNADKKATEGQAIPTRSAAAGTESTREGVAVVTGSPAADVTIDVYADFLCPVCKQFEEVYGERISGRVAAGEVRLRTHMLPMLTNRSDPPGYSLDAANAALCAADEGKFTAFHNSLFAAQPREGTRGYDNRQLIDLGTNLGITGGTFAACVNNGTYDDELTAEFTQVKDDPKLQQDFGSGPGFGTPTVVANGEIVDLSDDAWLANLVDTAKG
ncbi:MAG: DsbA family protein [Haloechinothrix sp.]